MLDAPEHRVIREREIIMGELFRRHRVVVVSAVLILVAVVTAVVLLQTGVFSSRESADDGVPSFAAAVNGSEISREALDRAAAELTAYYRQATGGEASYFVGASGAHVRLRIFYEAFIELVRRALIRQEAEARGLAVSEDDIDERANLQYQTLLGEYGIAETQHAAFLKESGSSLEEYQQNLRDEVELQLVTESVQQAMIESAQPDEEALAAYFEENGDRYATADGQAQSLEQVEADVRSDYIDEHRDRIIGEWYQSLLASADIEITIPLLRAYDLQQKDPELGLAEFDRLRREGELADAHLPYYMARLAEGEAAAATGERLALEGLSELTDAQAAEVVSLREKEKARESQAIALYIEALQQLEPDESFVGRIMRLNPDEKIKSFLSGVQLALRGDQEGAEELFDQVLEDDPSFVPAYIVSGDLALRMGNSAHAMRRYEGAQEHEPENVNVLLRMARLWMAMDDLAEAQSVLTSVRSLQPNSPWLRIAEGDLAAIRLEAAVLELETGTSAEHQVELEAQVLEQSRLAIDAYRDALERSGDLEINLKLGRVQWLAGDLDAAESEYEYVIRYSPYTADAYEGLGEVLALSGNVDAATSAFRTALFLALGVENHIRLLERIVALLPSEVADRLELAELYAEQDRWADVVRVYNEVIDNDPMLADVYLLLGEAHRLEGAFDLALDALQRGLDAASFETQRMRLLEAIVATSREQVGADQPLRVVGLDAQLELAGLGIDAGDVESALARIRSVRDADPTHRAADVREFLRRIEETDPALLTEQERTP